MTGRRRAAVAIAIAAVASTAALAAPPVGRATADRPQSLVEAVPTAQRLYMITDSVGLGAAPAIRAAFAGWQVTIDSDAGEFTETLERAYVAPRVSNTPGVFGDHAIVAAGYNYPYWDPARFDRSVNSMIATLGRAGVRHVHWVTLREVREQDVGPRAWRGAAAWRWYLATVNDHLEAALERHPNLSLIDWAAVANQPGLTYDAIHLNPTGAALYSSIARRSVDVASTRVADGSVTRVRVPDADGVAAVSVNVTVTDPRHVGYLTAFPCDASPPTASFHNSVRGDTVAHSTVVPLDDDGAFCIATRVATNLIVDLTGRFPDDGGYLAVGPTRWADTRTGAGPVASGGTLVLDLDDLAGELGTIRPDDVGAVALSVTVTQTAGPGYITATTGCAASGETSNVNYAGGDTIPNLVIVEPDPTGRVCIGALTRSHVVVDLLGVFDATAAISAASPVRVYDSRERGTLLPADTTIVVDRSMLTAAGIDVPADLGGVVLNLTAEGTAGQGYVRATPCAASGAEVSQLNMPDPRAVANAVIVPVDERGEVCVTASAATNLIIDVLGTVGRSSFEGVVPSRLLDTRAPG